MYNILYCVHCLEAQRLYSMYAFLLVIAIVIYCGNMDHLIVMF